MALCVSRRPNLGGRVALALFGAIAAAIVCAPMAGAQVIVGGNRLPAVTVNTSVLDRLGPALTLPQLFLSNAGYVARPTATASRAPTQRRRTRRVATRRAAPAARRVELAQAAPSSLNQIIHLIPPPPRVANAAPARHDEAAISEPTQATVAALAAPATTMAAPPSAAPTPAPAPQQPQSRDTPTPPILPSQPASVTPPSTPVAPPTQTASTTPPPFSAGAGAVTGLGADDLNALGSAPGALSTPARSVAANPAATTPAPTVVASAAPSPSIATAPAATSNAPPVQMAAATTVGSGMSSVKFGPSATDLPPGPQPALDAVVAKLLADNNLRVQVIAHATGGPDEAMEARRVSLARAVGVRAYLIDKGVRSLRIDVRALGNRADNGPVADQVDLMVLSQ